MSCLLLSLVLLIAGYNVGCRDTSNFAEEYDLNRELPPFLDYLAPAPGSTLSLEDYQSGLHYRSPNTSHPPPGDAENRICAEIDPGPILEPGDFFEGRRTSGEFLPDQFTLLVDAKKATLNIDDVVSFLVYRELYDEKGNVIAHAPALQIVCWLAELKPGTHIAVLAVEKTSGETLEYAWSFTILD